MAIEVAEGSKIGTWYHIFNIPKGIDRICDIRGDGMQEDSDTVQYHKALKDIFSNFAFARQNGEVKSFQYQISNAYIKSAYVIIEYTKK